MGNIKSVKYVGDIQTYDLEVNHQDHQFYLSNGMLTSNSHAVLYSMTGYETAYLKAHFPNEFLLANLMAEVNSNTPDAKSNISKIKKEMKANKIKIVSPDINKSGLNYNIIDNKLITGLDSLKFVGEEAIQEILAKRPFTDFFDFMSRCDSKALRANAIQALAASGCLNSFNMSRKQMYLYCSDYRKKLQTWCKRHDPKTEVFTYPWTNEPEWSVSEIFALENYYLGDTFICKPHEAYINFFKNSEDTSISEFKKYKDKSNIKSIKGIIKDYFEFKVKKEGSKYYGQSMIKAVFEDKNGDSCTLTIFPDKWQYIQDRIKEIHRKYVFGIGSALHFSGNTNNYEDDVGIILDQLYNFSPPPPVPEDLKAKKVALTRTKKIDKLTKFSTNPQDLQQQLEDELYDEGLIDFNSDIEDN